MNRAAQAASGRPSGIGACELAGFSCKRSYLVRKTTADFEESMLSPEILARVLLLQMHRARQPNATSEDLLED